MKTRLVYAVSMLFVIYGCAAAHRLAGNDPAPPQPKASPGTLASPALQKETLSMILFTDDALSNGVKCSDRRIIKKEVIKQAPGQGTPGTPGTPGSWTERWTLNRCGATLRYRVDYTSGKKGKAYFTVKKEK